MKKNWSYSLLALLTAFVISCGSSTSTPGKPSPEDIQNQSVSLYEINQTVELDVKNELNDESTQSQLLVAGSAYAVIEHSPNGQWVRIAIEVGDDVDNVWVESQSLKELDATVIEDSDPYDQEGNEILPQSDSEESYLRKKMTYCYRYVKLYLLNHGMVKSYLPGGSAYMAATTLPKYGFTKVSRSAANAIVNDVCVYKGGPSGHGHIEIKTAKGWYYGYGYKASPIKNRIFIACFHK